MKKLLSVVVMLTFILVPAGNILACSDPGPSKVSISCPSKVRINSCIEQAKTSVSLPVIKINGVPLAKEYISANSCKAPVKLKASDKPKAPVSKPKTPAPSKPQKPVTPAPQPQPPGNPVPDPKPGNEDSFNPSSLQSEMLAYINAERAKDNLSPFVLDEKLCQGAYLKSKDMAVNNYFSHNSPTYGSPFDMMKDLGIAYRLAGENIAKNTSVKGAHQAFMNSSGHRANILNSGFKKLGLGFYQSGSYLYVTQWFTN
ncbi:MAG: hypothetical protein GX229_07650 [Syntrophomonadaceae bacterium]|jgi:uncharacterized YkwD family protein|nr:hypothetical protein [Syntrophomonadaceae bacterium]